MEIDLLVNYPVANRTGVVRTDEDRKLAKQFGKEFFDGTRSQGYGGYRYDPKYFKPVVPLFAAYYDLEQGDSVLDVGCAKGHMLQDFKDLGMRTTGIDVSLYAIENALPNLDLHVGDARSLPFDDQSFDLVVSLGTLHNLDRKGVIQSLGEIERVGRNASFITVDAYRTEAERKRMEAWNLTALTVLHVDEWVQLFDEAGYTGDYFWIFA